MITKAYLKRSYIRKGRSMQQIASDLSCSLNTVVYWMKKYKIKRRSISNAIYQWHNPEGDPFKFIPPKTSSEIFLMGLGLGLYWGEGTKANKNSIRLGNTDPKLIKTFIKFLTTIFRINMNEIRFGLQIFTDIDPIQALDFWVKTLNVKRVQFQKPTITISGSLGTYRKKSKYGVITVYFHNKKARDLLVSKLPM